MTDNPISSRVVGAYPLSIATSLSIEAAIGNHPDHPSGKNVLKNYDVVWINLRTVFRNLYNAISKENLLAVMPAQLYDGIVQEIDQLERIIQSESKGKTRVVFYFSKYAHLERAYPKALLRLDATESQKTYTFLQKICLNAVIASMEGQVRCFDLKITDREERKALMLTHCPLDLFSKEFKDKSLWESHTGAIKPKHQWYTKYYNGRDLPMIPFREDLIQIFGDNEHFRPMSIGLRKQIIELAVSKGWSQVTTRDKIVYTLDQLENKDTRALIHDILHK